MSVLLRKTLNTLFFFFPIRDRSLIPVPGHCCVFEVATTAFRLPSDQNFVLQLLVCNLGVCSDSLGSESLHRIDGGSASCRDQSRRQSHQG